jgi:hypothetical protein
MANELPDSLQILHVLRVRGMADENAVADALGLDREAITAELGALAERDLVVHKQLPSRSGWLLLPAGHAEHGEQLGSVRDEAFERAIDAGYERFLEVNRPMKELCTDWQTAGGEVPADAVGDELDELRGVAGEGIDSAAQVAPWFASYNTRLAAAVKHFTAGDERYLISPQVDSFHMVWSECHEDFLVSLGRERSDRDE